MSCLTGFNAPNTITKTKLATLELATDATSMSVEDGANILTGTWALFDGCGGTCTELVQLGTRTHSAGVTTFAIVGRGYAPNDCSLGAGSAPSCKHYPSETIYVNDSGINRVWCDLVNAICTTFTIKSCTDVRKCFTAGTGINITDGVISSTIEELDCDDVEDCVKALPDYSDTQGASRVLGVGCDGEIGRFRHAPSEVDVISATYPSIVENPWSDAGWVQAPAGGGAVYATKVFHIADFDIPNYPACAGTEWRATISFGLDHIPSGANPGDLTLGYFGYNPKLNGNDPLGGIMQVGDHWSHNVGKKGMGGSPNFCAEFVATPGSNSFDIVMFITSDTPAYNESMNINSLKLQVRTKLVHV